jgi:hypothetical protein
MVRQRYVTRVAFALLAPVLFAACVSGGANLPVTPNPGPSTNPSSNISASPQALGFSATGAANNKTFSVTDVGYTRTLSVTSADCGSGASAIVTFAPTTAPGPVVTVTVTPRNAGLCHITISDDNNGSVTVPVFVGLLNAPPSLAFSGTGAAYAQTFNISYPGYTGTLTINPSTCGTGASAKITFDKTTFTVPNTVTVTPQNAGACSFIVSDNQGNSVTIGVTVNSAGVVVSGHRR